MRYLLAWQKVAPDHQMEGPESVRAIVEQLRVSKLRPPPWEGELLPGRLAEYDPAWLDALCLSGEVVWARLTPPTASRTAAAEPGNERARRHAGSQHTDRAGTAQELCYLEFGFSTALVKRSRVLDNYCSGSRLSDGARRFFFTDIVEGTKMLRAQVEEALAELVANGLVISDSFAGLRALLTPASRRTQAAARRKHRQPVYEMSSAGRWSLLDRKPSSTAPPQPSPLVGRQPVNAEAAEEIARILLKRYGVVFKRLLEREGIAAPLESLAANLSPSGSSAVKFVADVL